MVTSYPAMVLSRCRVLQTQAWYLAAVCDACAVPPWACIVMGGPVLLPTLRRHLLSRSVHTAREPLAGREKPDVLAACLQWASFLVVPESLRARAATRPGYVSETLDGSGSALHDTGQSTGHLSLPRSRGGLPCGHWKLTENNWRAK